jgi:hypothetical protein
MAEKLKPEPRDLRVQAAMLGPGFRGKRSELGPEEKSDKARDLQAAWRDSNLGEPPTYLAEIADGKPAEWRERRAKLFEAGAYDDKGLQVAHSHLQSLESSFDEPVPILVEHIENPLRLGYLTDVQAVGSELFGTLALTKEADELLESSGATSLSLCVSKDLRRIHEVSIVANPRVDSARLFCADFRQTEGGEWKREALRLRQELSEKAVADSIARFADDGVIPPAAVRQAEILLRAAQSAGIDAEVLDFLRALPKMIHFGEMAPAKLAVPSANVDELDFYRRHFAEVPVEEILKRRTG